MLIVGCAQQPLKIDAPSPPEIDAARSAALNAIENWSFQGRAAVQRDSEGWSAKLHWRQTSDGYRLRIIAPLGRGTFEILSGAGGVRLIDANNQVYQSDDPETLLRQTTGWELPISDIEYWVRGLLRPETVPQQLTVDNAGRLRDFASGGWRVSYLEYQATDSIEMPRKMFMSHGDTKMRLVIASWQLSGAGGS